jgi:hypothetical protein
MEYADIREQEAAIRAFLSGFAPEVQEVALELRRLASELAPEAIEQLDVPAKMLAYGFQKTYKDMICVIMPLKAGVNLGFPRGAELPDPDGLLAGSGKRARHIRISTQAEACSPAVRALLEASIAQVKAG